MLPFIYTREVLVQHDLVATFLLLAYLLIVDFTKKEEGGSRISLPVLVILAVIFTSIVVNYLLGVFA